MTETEDRTVRRRVRDRRRRLAARMWRLRDDARRYRKLSAALAGALALALVALATLVARADRPDRIDLVDLGQGVAGVEAAPGAPRPETGGTPPARELLKPAKPAPAPPESPSGRRLAEGRASYYSDSLEGRPTASGETYRGGGLTAAHRTLPFGSRLRVTNLANGRTVIVRVNDRGPFARRRVLDLSRAAASHLGMLRQGHAPVRLELLD